MPTSKPTSPKDTVSKDTGTPISKLPAKSFYVQRLKCLHTRYKLSDNAIRLLKALDDHHTGAAQDDALGRLVRLSPNMRKAATETIAKCAAIIQKQPDELRDCVALIENCTEILAIADQEPSKGGFALMKAPKEIRFVIYRQYIKKKIMGVYSQFHRHLPLIPVQKLSTCACLEHEPIYGHRGYDLALATVSKQVSEEFLACLYQQHEIHFSCLCDLRRHLSTNKALFVNIREIKVHWLGPEADTTFRMLAKMKQLKHLTLEVSKATTANLSKRQVEMNRYFEQQSRQPRLSDALGMDELLEIRGLESVDVHHILAKQGKRRTDEEKANLKHLLRDRLLQPRSDYQSSGDET